MAQQTARKMDLNTATEEQIAEVPQIGRTRAQKLIESRPFHSWEDVKKVPSFSAGMIDDLKEAGFTVGEEESEEQE